MNILVVEDDEVMADVLVHGCVRSRTRSILPPTDLRL